jgi:hypothetical protein
MSDVSQLRVLDLPWSVVLECVNSGLRYENLRHLARFGLGPSHQIDQIRAIGFKNYLSLRSANFAHTTIVGWGNDLTTRQWSAFCNVLLSPQSSIAWNQSSIPIQYWAEWFRCVGNDIRTARTWNDIGVLPKRAETLTRVLHIDYRDIAEIVNKFGSPERLLTSRQQSERVGRALADSAPIGVDRKSNKIGEQHLKWIAEVVESAKLLLPDYPMPVGLNLVFNSELLDLNIGLELRRGFAQGHVGTKKHREQVHLNLVGDFALEPRKWTLSGLVAYGLAISFLIDCVLIRNPEHSIVGNRNSNALDEDFLIENVSKIIDSRDSPFALHLVAGHIRHLHAGWTPREHSVKNAPSVVRALMGPQDTFVRAHLRGNDPDQLKTNLRERMRVDGALAHAISTVPFR